MHRSLKHTHKNARLVILTDDASLPDLPSDLDDTVVVPLVHGPEGKSLSKLKAFQEYLATQAPAVRVLWARTRAPQGAGPFRRGSCPSAG